MILKELGYIVLAARDLPEWKQYTTRILGGMAGETPEGALRLRFDERDCRILVQPSGQDKLLAVGWLVTDQEAFAAAREHVRASGIEAVEGTPQECIARRVTAFFAVRDPGGNRHEIGWGPVVNFREPFHSPAGVSAFRTGDQGMGHLVIGCAPAQYEAGCLFLRQALGLKLANFRSQELVAGLIPFPVSWFHCDNNRQHSVGFAPFHKPGEPGVGIRHINLEVGDIDDVGRAYDRAMAHGMKIGRTLGSHVNDRAISFYVQSPGGFLIEYGCDAPPRNWGQEIAYDEGGAGSVWGHHWQ